MTLFQLYSFWMSSRKKDARECGISPVYSRPRRLSFLLRLLHFPCLSTGAWSFLHCSSMYLDGRYRRDSKPKHSKLYLFTTVILLS